MLNLYSTRHCKLYYGALKWQSIRCSFFTCSCCIFRQRFWKIVSFGSEGRLLSAQRTYGLQTTQWYTSVMLKVKLMMALTLRRMLKMTSLKLILNSPRPGHLVCRVFFHWYFPSLSLSGSKKGVLNTKFVKNWQEILRNSTSGNLFHFVCMPN